mmetsp:Transcript_24069/g.74195  ORF Transcript_24069/g.74195 Transcript_24069/m.74195 type:complete len:552 (+) Transcript_24069:59-1714(+)
MSQRVIGNGRKYWSVLHRRGDGTLAKFKTKRWHYGEALDEEERRRMTEALSSRENWPDAETCRAAVEGATTTAPTPTGDASRRLSAPTPPSTPRSAMSAPGAKRQRTEAPRGAVPGLTDEQAREFWRRGWLRVDDLDPSVLKTLCDVSERVLPHERCGGKVHDKKGCRIKTWVPPHVTKLSYLPDHSAEEWFKTAAGSVETAALDELVAHFKAALGRAASDDVKVDFMLSFAGQTPQSWHVDAPSTIIGAVVYLTAGGGTLYANYEGQDLAAVDDRRGFLERAWSTIQDAGHEPQGPRGDGADSEVPAGAVVLSNTCHIHKQPPPPPPGAAPRRTVFLALEDDGTARDAVFSSDWRNRFAIPVASVGGAQETAQSSSSRTSDTAAAAPPAAAAAPVTATRTTTASPTSSPMQSLLAPSGPTTTATSPAPRVARTTARRFTADELALQFKPHRPTRTQTPSTTIPTPPSVVRRFTPDELALQYKPRRPTTTALPTPPPPDEAALLAQVNAALAAQKSDMRDVTARLDDLEEQYRKSAADFGALLAARRQRGS